MTNCSGSQWLHFRHYRCIGHAATSELLGPQLCEWHLLNEGEVCIAAGKVMAHALSNLLYKVLFMKCQLVCINVTALPTLAAVLLQQLIYPTLMQIGQQ
jgi:hypothetical protein